MRSLARIDPAARLASAARTYRLPSSLLAQMSGRVVVLILLMALKTGAAVAATSTVCELSLRAIVNGRNLQPRADCLKALGRSDLPPQAADEVDRIYKDSMRT